MSYNLTKYFSRFHVKTCKVISIKPNFPLEPPTNDNIKNYPPFQERIAKTSILKYAAIC